MKTKNQTAARRDSKQGALKSTPVAETPVNVIVETGATTPVEIVTEPAPAPAPAPIALDMTDPANAPNASAPAPAEVKVSWEETMKKAQASFAKTGSFREGTNRFVLYPLLDREEGLSLVEAAAATQQRGGKPRNTSSIHTDLHDIAKITQRKLVRCDKGTDKRYKLAPVASAPVATVTEEVK